MHTDILTLLDPNISHPLRTRYLEIGLLTEDKNVHYYLDRFCNIQNMNDYKNLLECMIKRKISHPQEHLSHNIFRGILNETVAVYPSYFVERFLYCLENNIFELHNIFREQPSPLGISHETLSYYFCIDKDAPIKKDLLLNAPLSYIVSLCADNYRYFPMENMKHNVQRCVIYHTENVKVFPKHKTIESMVDSLKTMFPEDTWYTCIYENCLLSELLEYAPNVLSEEEKVFATLYGNITLKELKNNQNYSAPEINLVIN